MGGSLAIFTALDFEAQPEGGGEVVPGGGGVLLLFSGPGLEMGEIGLIMLLEAVLDRA